SSARSSGSSCCPMRRCAAPTRRKTSSWRFSSRPTRPRPTWPAGTGKGSSAGSLSTVRPDGDGLPYDPAKEVVVTRKSRFVMGCGLSGLVVLLALADQGAPPPARRVPFEETFHGVTLTDPYHWLEDFDAPEASAYLSAQDEYARAFLARMPGQEALRRRLTQLLRTESVSVPRVEGGRTFYSRTRVGADLPVLCVRKGLDGPEEILLDPA